MSIISIVTLKTYFQTGDFPTENQFVDLIDTLTGAGIYFGSKSLTAAQIKTLNSVPITLVAAPGAGYAVEVTSGWVDYTYGGTPFTSNQFWLKTDTASLPQRLDGGVLPNATSVFVELSPYTSGTTTQIVNNKALNISADADSAVGNGTAKVYFTYRIITLI